MRMKTAFSSIRSLLRHYKSTAAILGQILAKPMSFEESVQVLKDRLANRESNFLSMLERCIYANPNSPHRVLLQHAGYGFERVAKMVKTQGIEKTLETLYKDGVYIEILEFKGKKEIVRGNRTFRFVEKDFNNPLLTGGFDTQSGGTRGAGTKMSVPLEFIHQNNVYGIFGAHEYGMLKNKVVIWLPILPAGEGLFFSLRFAAMGNPPVKWFSQTDERYTHHSAMDKLKTVSSIWMAKFYRKRLPRPEFVDMRDTLRIAKWLGGNLNCSPGFSVVTYSSSALRLVTAARKEGIDLGKTIFWLMGEPLTAKISEEIESYGCKAYSLYGCNELMIIGQGCPKPVNSDDMHFLSDKLAVIQHERRVEHSDISVNSFLFTTLWETSPKVFLNTETGDYGIIERRKCGCTFDKLGYSEHIHTIRSFEKLTAEGVTFIGSNLISLIQDTLPSQFGGDGTSYQFVEDETKEGLTKLFVLVSPEIGEVDEDKLKKAIFNSLCGGPNLFGGARLMWNQADTINIKRQYPIPTRRGKIVPIQIRKRGS